MTDVDLSPPSRRPRLWHLATRSLLVLGLAWLGIETYLAWADLIRGPQPRPALESPPAPGVWLSAAGQWQFGESAWSVAVEQVAERELRDRLDAPVADRPTAIDSRASAELFTLARLLGFRRQVDRYHLDHAQLCGRLFVAGDRLYLVRIAVPDAGGIWQMLTLRPTGAGDGIAEDLLPLPPGSRRMAVRRGADDRVDCEIIACPNATWAGLREFWRSTDWQVSRDDARLLARQGEQTIHGWLHDTGDRLVLLLLRGESP